MSGCAVLGAATGRYPLGQTKHQHGECTGGELKLAPPRKDLVGRWTYGPDSDWGFVLREDQTATVRMTLHAKSDRFQERAIQLDGDYPTRVEGDTITFEAPSGDVTFRYKTHQWGMIRLEPQDASYSLNAASCPHMQECTWEGGEASRPKVFCHHSA